MAKAMTDTARIAGITMIPMIQNLREKWMIP